MAGIEPFRTTGEEGQVQAAAPGRWRGTHAGWFSAVSPLPQAPPRAHGSQPVVNSQLNQETATDESSEDVTDSCSLSQSSIPVMWPAPQPVAETKVHYLWDAGEDSSSMSGSVVSGTCSLPQASVPSRAGASRDVAGGSLTDAGDRALDDEAEPRLSYSDFLIASRRDKDIRHEDMDYWLQRIPLNEKGHVTSIGSIAHVLPDAKCKPCIFLSTVYGCERGRECPSCHLSHKFRMCKGKRDRTKRLLEKHEQSLAQQRQGGDSD